MAKKEGNAAEAIVKLFDRVGALSKIQRILIAVGCFGLVLGLFIGLSFFPKFKEISTLSDELGEIENQLRVANAKAAKVEDLRKEKKDADRVYRQALKLLPDEKEIPSLLTAISKSGKDSDLDFLLFQPQDERPKELVIEMPVSVNVSGSYHQIASFFDKISKLFRIVNVTNFKIIPAESEEGENALTATGEVVTYRFMESVETGDDDSNQPAG